MYKSRIVVVLLAIMAVVGCGPEPTQKMGVVISSEYSGESVSVTRVGVFEDTLAYSNVRGIYRIIDRKTGKEYLGISGVGISEVGSHSDGKANYRDER